MIFPAKLGEGTERGGDTHSAPRSIRGSCWKDRDRLETMFGPVETSETATRRELVKARDR